MAMSALLFVLFAATAYLSIVISQETKNVAALWPANGIALAVMLRGHRPHWPAYALATAAGNVAANLFHGDSFWVTLGFTVCNLSEVLLAYGLLQRTRIGADMFSSSRAIFLFFVIAALAAALTATLGAGLIALAFGGSYEIVWRTWWIGDVVGLLIVTPLLLAWSRRIRLSDRLGRPKLQDLVIGAGFVLVSILIFGLVPFRGALGHVVPILTLPFQVWATYRFGVRGATAATAFIAVTGIIGILRGTGALVDIGEPIRSVAALQLLLATTGMTALMLAVALAEGRRAQAHLRSALDSMHEGFALYDAEDRLVTANRQYAEMYGEDPDDLRHGETFEEIVRRGLPRGAMPVAKEHIDEWVKRRLRERAQPSWQGEQRLSNGRWVLANDQRTEDGYSVNVRTDITRLKQQEQALRSSEERFRRVVEASPTALVMIDRSGRIALANSQAETIFGYGPGELVGQSVEVLVPEPLRASHPARRAEFFEAPSARAMGSGRDLRARRKDGSEFPVEIGLNPIQTAEGIMVLSAVVDISQRKQSEVELTRLLSENRTQRELAEAANRAKSDFLAMMSHEIRTPMNAVMGYTEMLLDSSLSASQRRHAGIVHDSARGLLTIINDILDLSKIEAGKFEIDGVDFDPVEVVEAVTAMMREPAESKGLALTLSIGADVPRALIGDPGRLRQVLLNLLNNAVKFTDRGRVDVEIVLQGATAERATLRISVTDTGIGIPEGSRDRLFTPFSQLADHYFRRAGGTGLGLTIAKRLVEMMGGGIDVDSAVGRGSRFSFTVDLPRAERKPPVEPVAVADQAPSRPLRLLLVDDVEINRELASGLLTAAGHSVDTACDGAEAVGAVAVNHYDLVLMDVQMPIMDGFEATARIRSLPTSKCHIPIIAMTAYASMVDIQRCLKVGMNGHVAKPISRVELLTAVSRATSAAGDAPSAKAPPATSLPDEILSVAALELLERSISREKVAGLVAMLEDRLERVVLHIGHLLLNGRYDQVRSEAHKLIAETGNLGLTRLSAMFRRLQDEIASGARPESAGEFMAELSEVSRTSINQLLRRYAGQAVPQKGGYDAADVERPQADPDCRR